MSSFFGKLSNNGGSLIKNKEYLNFEAKDFIYGYNPGSINLSSPA
jgi:hypothetical protein